MRLKRHQLTLLLAGLLSLSVPALAQALTWEEWNHSSSPFCGFISVFCVPPKAPPQAVTAAEPIKVHKHKKQAEQPKTPS